MINSFKIFVISYIFILIIHFSIKNYIIQYEASNIPYEPKKIKPILKMNNKIKYKNKNKISMKNDLISYLDEFGNNFNKNSNNSCDLNKYFEIQNNELYLFENNNLNKEI
ncbi:unnamed protein product [marine sediment metagenome]|uniref:Uncharacterized protein n=1 Tax=marine sediment metagenome TaxID=412755 RepID=X0Y861_9ZZZZ